MIFSAPEASLYSQSESREDWVYRWAGDADATLLRRDQARTFVQANSWPACLAIRSAEGSEVEDFSGRRYIDLHGNNCHHIGHRHPDLIAALQGQMQSLAFNVRGFTNHAFIEFAEQLGELWPGDDPGLFLVPGGSAAIELALMLARVHGGRYKSLSFSDSFHGRSLGAIGLTASRHEKPRRLGPLLPGSFHVPSCRPNDRCSAEDAALQSRDSIRNTLRKEGDIACLVAEPISNGGYLPPDWYWPEIRDLCDRHDCLLVFDEIPMGLGKTGWLFNSEVAGVIPDITVLGKALGGSMMPVGVVIAGRKLDTAADLNLGYFTHEKNPLMARAASETLAIIRRENLVERSRRLGPQISARLKSIEHRYPELIRESRGVGMIHSLHLYSENDAKRLFFGAIEQGLLLNYPGYGANIKLSLALNIDAELMDLALTRLDAVLGGCRPGVPL